MMPVLEGVGEAEFTLWYGFERVRWWDVCPIAEGAAGPGGFWGPYLKAPAKPSAILLVRGLGRPHWRRAFWGSWLCFLRGSE